jgi:hypothetical protein
MSTKHYPEGADVDSTEVDLDCVEVTERWEFVHEYRRRIRERFSYLGEVTRDALALAVSELAENVVKYAAHEPEYRPTIAIHVTSSSIFIRSENLARSEDDGRLAIEIVGRLAAELAQPTDATAIYASKIEEALEEGVHHSRQGFYRIAAIAGFGLRAEMDGRKLAVSGERAR